MQIHCFPFLLCKQRTFLKEQKEKTISILKDEFWNGLFFWDGFILKMDR